MENWANEILKIQEVPKTKVIKADITPTISLYQSLPECSHFTNSLSGLPFHSEETIKQLPFKIRLTKASGVPLQLSSPLGIKAEPKTIVKPFPKPREDPQSFCRWITS